jgi:DUF4097 and DUF4098 domain-containing protein YvlB
MASTPPPYSSQDARWQARQARDAARAQRAAWKAQARAQKDYYRAMWRGGHRPSFVAPAVLLTIGIIALMLTTGHLDAVDFWSWYARWWPMLLIGLGGLLLLEHFMDAGSPWVGRRPMGGIVWLVILMIALGAVAHEGHLVGPFAWSFGDHNNDDFWSWMGPEHDNDVQIDQALSSAKPSITVNVPRGDVTITPSTDGQMHIRAHQMVHRSSDNETRQLFEELKPKVETSSSGAVVTVPDKEATRVDLAMEVPAAAYAVITAQHGDVTADGLTGGIQVTDDHGDVKLEDIAADAHARMNHGDFSAHNMQGKVLVDGTGDDVTISEVKGEARVDGEFFGDIHLEQVSGTVHYHSSMTDLEIPHLVGSLTLDKSDLSISRAAGPVRVIAKSKDIDMSQIAGDAHVEDSNGDVSVATASPLGNMEIADHTGDVVVTMPEDASFSVTGNASGDEDIRTDFPLHMTNNDGRQTLDGTVGHGGVRLHLEAEHGNLELRKGSSVTLSMNEAGDTGETAKHFKAPAGAKPTVEQQ